MCGANLSGTDILAWALEQPNEKLQEVLGLMRLDLDVAKDRVYSILMDDEAIVRRSGVRAVAAALRRGLVVVNHTLCNDLSGGKAMDHVVDESQSGCSWDGLSDGGSSASIGATKALERSCFGAATWASLARDALYRVGSDNDWVVKVEAIDLFAQLLPAHMPVLLCLGAGACLMSMVDDPDRLARLR